ncbi:MAG: signal peptide peptidase SppA [Bacteroidota bacterium]|nr:signal peptide peptidase SppA [Bacteroidota bacterium]
MKAFFRNLLASILGFFISLVLLFLFFVAIVAVALGGQKKEVTVSENSILTIKLNEEIPERPVDGPFEDFGEFFEEFDQPISLSEILDNIKYAKEDSRIEGIYLETGLIQGSFPTLESIRNALLDFKQSGKFVYAYSELYTQRNYYVASVADSIFINPEGVFGFAGFHSEQVFFKGLLSKLDIEANVLRAGKYKSAAEAFMNEKLSEENRQQITAFMQSAYGYYLSRIGEARNVDAAQLKVIADNLKIRFPADAVAYKLADKVAYKDEVLAAIKNKLDIDDDKKIKEIEIEDYRSADHPVKKYHKEKIAVIYAIGQIGGGEGDEENIGSDKVSEAIRQARLDKNIKAIVLRINSPGGSALASDVIWREVELARQAKPVVASMGGMAASGGYYIAAPCDTIVCQPNTLTGSIGVFAILPMWKNFWNEHFGITFDRVKTGPYADLGNPNRAMTAEEKAIIQTYIDSTYVTFKRRVAQGRNLSLSTVDEIAQGRIYSGLQAKELGLVDVIGDLDTAIAIAARMADVKDYSIKLLPKYETKFAKVFSSMMSARSFAANKELEQSYAFYRQAEGILKLQGILMLYPFDVMIY